MLNTP